MERKKIKRYVYWGIFVLFVVGSIWAGSPFDFLDFIVVRPIVNILFVIFNLVHDFGLAIIIFTVLVKICMLPLARRQLNQMKLIRKIQPMLTEIKKNCNGNKQLESIQTMDLYRRYNVKPFASIVTLLIQLPIFVALFAAIKVIATPNMNDNLMNRAYSFVAYDGSEIQELEKKQQEYLDVLAKNNKTDSEEQQETTGNGANSGVEYDFHPQLFGKIDLNVRAYDLLSGKASLSAAVVLLFAILSALMQYLVTKQQMPSGKSEKSKKFRDILQEAKDGRELDETDISNITTRQMSMMMPIMMFFVMSSLNGALVFYYLLSNILTLIQQKIILHKVNEEIDEVTDRSVLKELKNVREAEIVNEKTGTTIRRITAKDEKKIKGKTSTNKRTKSVETAKTEAKKGGKVSKKKGA